MNTLRYSFLTLLVSTCFTSGADMATTGILSHQNVLSPTARYVAAGGLVNGTIDTPSNPSAFMKNLGLMGNIHTLDANTDEYTIPNVPAYLWYHGSAPTAAGSIIAYLDSNGYPGLMPGGDATTTSVEGDFAYRSIASDQHYDDYSLPIDTANTLFQDKSETGNAHAPNCLADFMGTSFSSRGQYYGSTDVNQVVLGLATYVVHQYPELSVTYYKAPVTEQNLESAYEVMKQYVQANIPVLLSVNSDEGFSDHMVVAIGYRHNTQTGERQFIAYNSYDQEQHIYSFLPALNQVSPTDYTVHYGAYRVAAIHMINPDLNIYRRPVYYYYRPTAGTYFFTTNEQEKILLDTNADFEFAGISHRVFAQPMGDNTVPVYRFLDNLGNYFYTANEGEKDAIVTKLPHVYTLEGIAFYVLAGPGGGAKPVYRFFQPSTQSRFFTIDEAEKERRINEDPTMQYEGIAWFAFSD